MEKNFSVHTLEFIRVITRNESEGIMKVTRGEFKNYSGRGNDYHCYMKSPGIRMFLQFRGGVPTVLRLIVNLNAIYGDDENILFNPLLRDINKVFFAVDNAFEEENLNLCLSQFKVGRVDFTVDIQTDSDEEVMAYIALAKRKGLDKNYRNKYKPGSKNIIFENSFDAVSKSTEFTLYNKYRQLLDIGYSEEEANYKYGTLRMEVKLCDYILREQIRGMCKENNISEIGCICEMIENSENVIKKYGEKFLTYGTHYKYKTAIKKVETLNIKDKYKKIAVCLISETAIRHNLRLAQKILVKQKIAKESQIKKVLDILYCNDINPITLGERSGFNELPSLLSLINEQQ
ncbi:MAG: phage/plasmid replication protein [Anaerotignaceae bacterium]